MKRLSYSETTEVEVDGARFVLGCIPLQKWTDVRLRARRAWLEAERRALVVLAGMTLSEEERDRRVAEEIVSDPVYRAAYEEIIREAVAWGVVGHTWEGGPAFEPTQRTYFGRTYVGASDSLVADYADTALNGGGRLVETLYLRVSEKASLGPDAKKKSPPPTSSPSTPDGPATNA